MNNESHEATDAEDEIQSYYDDGLISYQEYEAALEAAKESK